MGFDAAVPRDLAKKKRTNRSAKLKQCKLDARREQWLSQGQYTGPSISVGFGFDRRRFVEHLAGRDRTCKPTPPFSPAPSRPQRRSRYVASESLPPRKNNSVSSGSSVGSCSSDAEEEEENEELGGEKGGMDDWESVADALSADADHAQRRNPDPAAAVVDSKTIPSLLPAKPDPGRAAHRAWRLDDEFRPQSLPNLSKQHSFPVSMERHYGDAGGTHHGVLSAQTSCPICCEDLDHTDSSFLPCSCGFRLCLFCHKRILEADGRCPGCRNQYVPLPGCESGAGNGVMPLSANRLLHSSSMRPSS